MPARLLPRGFQALLIGLLGLLLQPAALAEPSEAMQWLERVAEASQSLNYEGVFVYQHQGGLEAVRVVHRVDENGIRERLYSLTGTEREIIRDNEQITCTLPDSRSVIIDRRSDNNPLAQLVPRDVEGLSRNYILKMTGESRIADRKAARVSILPRDKFRFGYQLWIDQQSGLLLQAEVFDEDGTSIEQLMFTELRLPETIPDAMLASHVVADGFSRYQEEPLTIPKGEASNWIFEDLPSGFALILHELRRMPGNDEPVEHLLFSDGLANVSVYIEKAGLTEAFTGHSALGAVRAYGRTLGESIQLIAVGEVPLATVERIALAIRPDA
jgi:sigma-E factor negative regulatory protein RseB